MRTLYSLKLVSAALLTVVLFGSLPSPSIAQNTPISEQSVANHVTHNRLAADVWFAPEDLSAAGRHALQQIAEALLRRKTEFASQMPGLEVNATVTIACYSRQPTFQRASALFAALGAKQIQLPVNELERRQALNFHLSAWRAETRRSALRELLTPYDRADPFLKIRYRPGGIRLQRTRAACFAPHRALPSLSHVERRLPAGFFSQHGCWRSHVERRLPAGLFSQHGCWRSYSALRERGDINGCEQTRQELLPVFETYELTDDARVWYAWLQQEM